MRLSAFGLLRVAALPLDPLLALAPPVTTRHIDAAVASLDMMRTLQPALEDALYAVLTSLQPHARASALEVRRAIHNDRRPNLEGELLADVLAALPEADRVSVSAWLDRRRACARASPRRKRPTPTRSTATCARACGRSARTRHSCGLLCWRPDRCSPSGHEPARHHASVSRRRSSNDRYCSITRALRRRPARSASSCIMRSSTSPILRTVLRSSNHVIVTHARA